jgi:hypothetical protein
VGNRKRGWGEGSIYRRKDGRWVGQYEVGGKRRYIYGKTRKEVAGKLTRVMADRDAGMTFDAGSLRVGDYLDRWLDSIRDTLRRRTWIRHEEIVKLHLKPCLGGIKLDRINPLQVQSYVCNPAPKQGSSAEDRSGDARALIHHHNPRHLLSRPLQHAGEGGRGYGRYLRGSQVAKI